MTYIMTTAVMWSSIYIVGCMWLHRHSINAMTLIAVFLNMKGCMYIDGDRLSKLQNSLHRIGDTEDHCYMDPGCQLHVLFETPDPERVYQPQTSATVHAAVDA